MLQFLGDNDIIEPDLDIAGFDPDLIISLDASNTKRLGKTYEKWEDLFHQKHLVVIDHHVSNPGFGNTNIIDTSLSSVCEILCNIIPQLELEQYVSPEAATAIYTGLQTDTNMYFNTNTR